MPFSHLSGLDLLSTAVFLIDENFSFVYANLAAEALFATGRKNIVGHRLSEIFSDPAQLVEALNRALALNASFVEYDLVLTTSSHLSLHVMCTASPVELGKARLLLELQRMDQQLKIARDERLIDQSAANRALIRNLAHEIRNPLGGIRGAAQLLEGELESKHLHEYTQVIMKEADRLRSLLDRLLTPSRLPSIDDVSIHEVLERVRSLILAEFPEGIEVQRDYDLSLPELRGDKEQLIQAVLNIARNAAQAMRTKGVLRFRTRIARQVTIAKHRYRLSLLVQIIDNGPGVPDSIRERIFDPLVSGREGGHGLGLTLAQAFVSQHHGIVECESVPGKTIFSIFLPLEERG